MKNLDILQMILFCVTFSVILILLMVESDNWSVFFGTKVIAAVLSFILYLACSKTTRKG